MATIASERKSTGPRTPEGKAASSMNALKHGLTAKTPLLPGEDPQEYRDFVWSMILDLRPVGPVQAELAQRVGVLMWKRKRLEGAEEQALTNLQDRYAARTEARLAQEERYAETAQERAEVEKERAEEAENGPRWDANQILADQFGGKGGGTLERLARYEQRLSQQIDSTTRLILKLQNRRQYQEQQQQQREQREQREREQRRQSEEAPKLKSAAVPARGETGGTGAGAGAGAVVPPPVAPAQNELVVAEPPAPENAPPAVPESPPGLN